MSFLNTSANLNKYLILLLPNPIHSLPVSALNYFKLLYNVSEAFGGLIEVFLQFFNKMQFLRPKKYNDWLKHCHLFFDQKSDYQIHFHCEPNGVFELQNEN